LPAAQCSAACNTKIRQPLQIREARRLHKGARMHALPASPPASSLPSWRAVDRALAHAATLDELGLAALWHALTVGSLRIVAERGREGQRTFLARPHAYVWGRDNLTPREKKVVRLVGRGLSNKMIAFELGTSIAAAGRGIDGAVRKFGVRSRIDLAIVAAAFDPSATRMDDSTASFAHVMHDGEPWVALAASLTAHPAWQTLSEAEREVADLALSGHDGATIARMRGCRSARTIANQLGCVFRKVGVSGRAELAARLVSGKHMSEHGGR
jgi:DNA-binding NarL/FixJ family response regulator